VENHRHHQYHQHIVWKRLDRPDKGKITPFDSRLVVAIGRAKPVIIIVTDKLAFLEALLEAVSRKRCFARGQSARGQPQGFGHSAGAP